MSVEELLLPDGFTPLTNQVAGHTFSSDNRALGMLKDEKWGCVLKPLGKPQCGERELSFYEQLNATNDPIFMKARCIVPKFYEKTKLQVNDLEHTFLKLEDLSHGIHKPCIMDIKIGQRTWDPLATPQKRSVEEEKYMKCKKTLGLCLPGFQMYKKNPLTNQTTVIKHGKDFGKQLDALAFRQTIALFLQSETSVCQALVQEFLKQLYIIRDWFNMQRLYHFYASSLLFVYDYDMIQWLRKNAQHNSVPKELPNGNTHPTQSANTIGDHLQNATMPPDSLQNYANNMSRFVKVRLIDFAHVFPANDASPDTNYIFGLQNLITIMEELLNCR